MKTYTYIGKAALGILLKLWCLWKEDLPESWLLLLLLGLDLLGQKRVGIQNAILMLLISNAFELLADEASSVVFETLIVFFTLLTESTVNSKSETKGTLGTARGLVFLAVAPGIDKISEFGRIINSRILGNDIYTSFNHLSIIEGPPLGPLFLIQD